MQVSAKGKKNALKTWPEFYNSNDQVVDNLVFKKVFSYQQEHDFVLPEKSKMENQIEIFESKDGVKLSVEVHNDSVWLSQEQLSILFDRDQSVISRHINNVFHEGELNQFSNMQKMHIAKSDAFQLIGLNFIF